MELNTYLPIITGLAGAFVGAFLKELGTFFQLRREDKRTLKTVLYNQLDLWIEVRRCDPTTYISLVFESLNRKIDPSGKASNEINHSFQQVQTQLAQVFKNVKLGEPEKIQQRYQESIAALAKVDPVLAYKLSGKADTESVHGKIESLIDAARKLSEPDKEISESDSRFLETGKDLLRNKLIKETSETLERDLLSVARRISLVTALRAWLTLRKQKTKMKDETSAEMDKLLDEILAIAPRINRSDN
jgi:CRISPR/Cas system CSM-associated protein Csm2 small subunit